MKVVYVVANEALKLGVEAQSAPAPKRKNTLCAF